MLSVNTTGTAVKNLVALFDFLQIYLGRQSQTGTSSSAKHVHNLTERQTHLLNSLILFKWSIFGRPENVITQT